jgi:hypothetical protein
VEQGLASLMGRAKAELGTVEILFPPYAPSSVTITLRWWWGLVRFPPEILDLGVFPDVAVGGVLLLLVGFVSGVSRAAAGTLTGKEGEMGAEVEVGVEGEGRMRGLQLLGRRLGTLVLPKWEGEELEVEAPVPAPTKVMAVE